MKPLTRSIKILFITWICLLSLLDFKVLSDSVLCLGKGGHVALEQAGDACCAPENVFDTHLSESKKHCGQCLDLRISAPFNNLPTPSKNIASHALLIPTIAFLQPAFAQTYAVLTPPAISDDTPLGETTLASRQSIVILV